MTPRAIPDEAVAALAKAWEGHPPPHSPITMRDAAIAIKQLDLAGWHLSRHAPDGAADEAMVERVARALYESRSPAGAPTWKQRGKVFRAASIEDARRLLGVGGDGADGR